VHASRGGGRRQFDGAVFSGDGELHPNGRCQVVGESL
jgi:hypothetical protein